MNYIDEGSTLPVPFNMIPTPKSCRYAWRWVKDLFRKEGDGLLDFERGKRQTFIKVGPLSDQRPPTAIDAPEHSGMYEDLHNLSLGTQA